MSILLSKFVELFAVTLVMAATTFISSIAPLKFFTVSGTNLTYLTNFSVGVLVGTALLIVLPEGVEILNEGMYKLTSFTVGLPILVGFVLMFTIEKFVGHNGNDRISYSATTNTNSTTSSVFDEGRIAFTVGSVLKSSITLGLLVHAAVDGISLGSSFADQDSTLQFVMVIALIIHKIPTAFSLGTILSKERLEDKVLLIHLGLFALSTPVSTWITFTIIGFFNTNIQFVTGILLLFSSGTFLYVVFHVINEFEDGLFEDGTNGGGETSGSDGSTIVDGQTKKKNIFVAIVGLMIPLLLSLIKE
ncbi:Golgi membrane protein [Candida orthopsilosis Co 90-125]|uniref:Golgi membrane protein n=1 Tax=Candida orthopsilosis (strain 90-125) TaxID=1136231 RepID=H8X5N3_CANO9|nr:Golgi membrane protein [Candida orthopsilosis Co 90-125]CCG23491.1 Golgi membrane protein [Candida orthopsilosis Co 90-125]